MKSGSSKRPNSGRPEIPPPSDQERTTFDWPRQTGTTDAVLQELAVQVRLRRRWRQRVRGAVIAVVALSATGWVWQTRVSPRTDHFNGTPVAAALPTRQVLSDGSVVLLRAGAVLSVDFSAATRRVFLTHGEALFEVAKNPNRPFVVRAAGVEVRAVGTAFAVNLKPKAVEVLVTEGQVAVEKPEGAILAGEAPMATTSSLPLTPAPTTAGADQPLALVSARNRVVVEIGEQSATTRPAVVPVSEEEIGARLSWRVAKLQFSRTPLAEAVAMINQHTRTRLVVEGTSLANVRLSGVIRADNIQALLELLESDYGICAEYRGETEVVLRKSAEK